MGLSVKVENTQSANVVILKGELTANTMGTLTNWFDGMIELISLPVVVNMTDLEFMDSKGVGYFIQLNERFANEGFWIAGLQPQVRDMLSRMFLIDKFKVFKKVEDAIDEAFRSCLSNSSS